MVAIRSWLAGRSPDAAHGLGFAAVGLRLCCLPRYTSGSRIERAWKCDSCRGCHFVVCVYWRRRGIHDLPAIRSPARDRTTHSEGWCERPQFAGPGFGLLNRYASNCSSATYLHAGAARVSAGGNDVIRRRPNAGRCRSGGSAAVCSGHARGLSGAANGSTLAWLPDCLLRCCPLGYDDIRCRRHPHPGCRGSHGPAVVHACPASSIWARAEGGETAYKERYRTVDRSRSRLARTVIPVAHRSCSAIGAEVRCCKACRIAWDSRSAPPIRACDCADTTVLHTGRRREFYGTICVAIPSHGCNDARHAIATTAYADVADPGRLRAPNAWTPGIARVAGRCLASFGCGSRVLAGAEYTLLGRRLAPAQLRCAFAETANQPRSARLATAHPHSRSGRVHACHLSAHGGLAALAGQTRSDAWRGICFGSRGWRPGNRLDASVVGPWRGQLFPPTGW